MAEAPLNPAPNPRSPRESCMGFYRCCIAAATDTGTNNNVMPKRGRNYPAIFCRSKKLSRPTAIEGPKLSHHFFCKLKILPRRAIARGPKLSRFTAIDVAENSQQFSRQKKYYPTEPSSGAEIIPLFCRPRIPRLAATTGGGGLASMARCLRRRCELAVQLEGGRLRT